MHTEKGNQTTWKPEHSWCRPGYKSKLVGQAFILIIDKHTKTLA